MFKIEGIIDRIEENFAVIILKDGQKLNWPISFGDNLREGQAISLAINSDEEQTSKKEQLAKDVLNEILKED